MGGIQQEEGIKIDQRDVLILDKETFWLRVTVDGVGWSARCSGTLLF